jgi:hypothetical protein
MILAATVTTAFARQDRRPCRGTLTGNSWIHDVQLDWEYSDSEPHVRVTSVTLSGLPRRCEGAPLRVTALGNPDGDVRQSDGQVLGVSWSDRDPCTDVDWPWGVVDGQRVTAYFCPDDPVSGRLLTQVEFAIPVRPEQSETGQNETGVLGETHTPGPATAGSTATDGLSATGAALPQAVVVAVGCLLVGIALLRRGPRDQGGRRES